MAQAWGKGPSEDRQPRRGGRTFRASPTDPPARLFDN